MIIGYDAKRAFQNRTGLGNYSRTLLYSLEEYFPEHEYYLFAPKRTNLFNVDGTNALRIKTPQWQPAKQFTSLWRSWWMTRDLKASNIQLYHGLSNEIPAGMRKSRIPSVVTIHDLIFERHPEQYHRSEGWIYKKKFRHACEQADAIIATSAHTKKDIVELYNIRPEKIHVCYQSCSELYWQPWHADDLAAIRKLYQLPENYFLYLGSITERKDLLTVCKALYISREKLNVPLVVVGEGKQYKAKVQQWLAEHHCSNLVIFLSDTPAAKLTTEYHTGVHFPAIYQNAVASIYPSMYEGFGIPVLEALVSDIPVITTDATSLPEVGGEAALYFSPGDVNGLVYCMLTLAFNKTARQECIQEGRKHVQQFTRRACAQRVLQVYQTLL